MRMRATSSKRVEVYDWRSDPELIRFNKRHQELTAASVPGDTGGYYYERLAERALLKKAVLLDVEANDTPLAVPVGKWRKGGDIEFLELKEAIKAARLLRGRKGFPNVRVVINYYEDLAEDGIDLQWGDPLPLCGSGLMFGLHYGYSDDAIAQAMLMHGGGRLVGSNC